MNLSRRLSILSFLALLPMAALYAQPRIDRIQNNYSYLLPGNPNYGIAQGSIFIITGSSLSTTTTGLQSVPLQKVLDGVSARVTVGGSSQDIIWYYVTPNQVAGILPSSTPVGDGTLTLTNSLGSNTAPIHVVQSAFGTLTLDGSGSGGAAVYDLNYSFLSATNSAKPGDVLQLFGTGIGPAAGDETILQTQTNLTGIGVTVEIGGVAGSVLYRGRTIYPGLDQINVMVPAGAPLGCNVSLVVKTGAFASNTSTLPVSSNGGACPQTQGPSGGDLTISQEEIDSWLAAGQYRIGGLGLTRQTSYSISDNPAGGQPILTTTRSDVFSASFNRISGPDLRRLLTGQTNAPAAGACTVYTGTIQNPYPGLTYTSLDAGASLAVTGPAGNRSAARSRNSVGMIEYSATIGTGAPGNYLDSGRYTFTGPGGADVGSFSGSIQIAPELEWTNRTALTVVDRSQPLTVTWTGGEPSTLVTIQGTSTLVQGTSVSSTSFQCYARNTDRTFTVPVTVLSQLPASGRITAGTFSMLQRGTLAIASVGTGARLSATGVDYLTAGNQWGVAQSAEYK